MIVVKTLLIEWITVNQNSVFCAIVGCNQPAMTALFEYSGSLSCKRSTVVCIRSSRYSSWWHKENVPAWLKSCWRGRIELTQTHSQKVLFSYGMSEITFYGLFKFIYLSKIIKLNTKVSESIIIINLLIFHKFYATFVYQEIKYNLDVRD